MKFLDDRTASEYHQLPTDKQYALHRCAEICSALGFVLTAKCVLNESEIIFRITEQPVAVLPVSADDKSKLLSVDKGS